MFLDLDFVFGYFGLSLGLALTCASACCSSFYTSFCLLMVLFILYWYLSVSSFIYSFFEFWNFMKLNPSVYRFAFSLSHCLFSSSISLASPSPLCSLLSRRVSVSISSSKLATPASRRLSCSFRSLMRLAVFWISYCCWFLLSSASRHSSCSSWCRLLSSSSFLRSSAYAPIPGLPSSSSRVSAMASVLPSSSSGL